MRSNRLAVLGCVLSFVFYIGLIQAYPVVYWGDAHVRLALRDQILVGHWLPLTQTLIFLAAKITPDLFLIRSILAVVALGALLGMYFLGKHLFSFHTGLMAAIFLAVNMMFVALAIVPYPEILFTLLVLLALYWMDCPENSRQFYLGVLALNLACLTRYEGWLLAAVFMLEGIGMSFYAKNWRKLVVEVPKRLFLCGIGPLAWLILGVQEAGGLGERLKSVIAFEAATGSQSLTDRLFSSLNLDYLRAFVANYDQLLNWQAGLWMIVLALLGVLLAILFAPRRTPHWRILAFVSFDWLLLALWQPQDFTSLRTAFIGETFLILYAAHGLSQLLGFFFQKLAVFTKKDHLLRWQGWALAGIILMVVYTSVSADIKFVAASSSEADFSIPAQAGAWLKVRLTAKDALWVLNDQPFQAYALGTYLQIPFEQILDNRFDAPLIHARLTSADAVYIVGLYHSKDALSVEQHGLLVDLENGRIPSQQFLVGSTHVWIVGKNEFAHLP